MNTLTAHYPLAKIVVVDDNSTNLILLTEVLKLAGFKSVVAFSHPADVIPYLRLNKADVLLVDQSMPDLSGLDLYLRIKIELVDHPISFLVTAHNSGGLAERAKAIGMYGFISKPFNIHRVVSEINEALTAREDV
jgi:two-component system chemotaxis response regulator CheY